jgi:hypothetical protein
MTLRAYARWCRHYEGFYQLLFNQLFRCILTIIEKKKTRLKIPEKSKTHAWAERALSHVQLSHFLDVADI